MAVTSGGVENLSNDTAVELASIDPAATPFGSLAGGAPYDYSNHSDSGDWSIFGQFADSADWYNQLYAGADNATLMDRSMLAATEAASDANSSNIRAIYADTYAATYNGLQENGADVSGMPHPDDVLASAQS